MYQGMRALLLPFLALGVSTMACVAEAQSQSATITAAQKNFPEFLELLRMPNVAAEAADMQRNAAFLWRYRLSAVPRIVPT